MSSGIDMGFVIGRAAGSAAPRAGSDTFRIVVVGDLSGRDSRRAADPDAPTFMPQRVDLDSFDRVFERFGPSLRLGLPTPGGSTEPALIRLSRFDQFEPDQLLLGQPLFARLRDLRARLADASTFRQAAAELRAVDAGDAALAGPTAGPVVAEDDAATLERLLGRPAPSAGASPEPTRSAAESAIDRLVRDAVAAHVVADHSAAQQPLLDAVDRMIAGTLRVLLRDPHWRAVEGAWQAIDRFVHRVEMDGRVRLELVDASAADLLDSLVAADGDAQRMPLASALLAGQRERGDPACAVVVALYSFGSGAAELALLAALGAVAAQQGALLLAGADDALALIDAPPGFDGIALSPPDAQARGRWQALRSSALAPHVGLVWPRLLTRLPYGPRAQPVSAFAFDELADGAGHGRLSWRVAALDLAALLASAFVDQAWDLQPESAVEIDDLPAHVDRSAGEPCLQAVAERYLSQHQAQAVAAAGVMPLVSDRSSPRARLAAWRGIGTDGVLAGRWAAR